jgi:hypothetical protein
VFNQDPRATSAGASSTALPTARDKEMNALKGKFNYSGGARNPEAVGNFLSRGGTDLGVQDLVDDGGGDHLSFIGTDNQNRGIRQANARNVAFDQKATQKREGEVANALKQEMANQALALQRQGMTQNQAFFDETGLIPSEGVMKSLTDQRHSEQVSSDIASSLGNLAQQKQADYAALTAGFKPPFPQAIEQGLRDIDRRYAEKEGKIFQMGALRANYRGSLKNQVPEQQDQF